MTAILLVIAVLAVSCASGGAKTGQTGPALYRWNFADAASGTAGWVIYPEDFWDYHGTATLSRDDKTFKKGVLRMDVDFSKDVDSDWSEPKMKMVFNTPVEGVKKISFDFIYDPELIKDGHFKSKVIIFGGGKQLAESFTDPIMAFDKVGSNYVKEAVSISVRGSAPVDTVVLSIAGYKVDYKGPVFFDNLRLE